MRLILHAAHAALLGHKAICIRTVDTDAVLLTKAFQSRIGCDNQWIAFGVGKNFRYVPIHELDVSLGQQKALALPFFHALTGYNTV